jgi:hypothetical protein
LRVGIIQSSYVPWRGYFDFIQSVDLFVFYDDVQYSTGSWRNRNRLKTPDGLKWLTVPVKTRLGLAIDEVPIEHSHPWQEQNRGLIKASLGRCPFFEEARSIWEEAVGHNDPTISQLNVRLTRMLCDYLRIRTKFGFSRTYGLSGTKTQRLIALLKQLGASTYLSGPSAKGYLDEDLFRSSGIRLEYKSYDYNPYLQLWGGFDGAVSILDLIANVGPGGNQHIHSTTPDVVAVP